MQPVRYIGIDVGDNKYYVVWYSSDDHIVHKEAPVSTVDDVLRYVSPKDSIVAIDAPSGVCKRVNGMTKRVCEEELCIVGYFQTPCTEAKAERWMRSGFNLWRNLEKNGFRMAVEAPLRAGDLIEVHPTIVFKKVFLKDAQIEPRLWIHQRNPPNKSKAAGKTARRDWLKGKFKGQAADIEQMRVDHLDALVAAYTAEYAQRPFGESCEGQIWFPA